METDIPVTDPVSVDTPVVDTPSQDPEVQVTPETPTVETPSEPQKFDLPDGRKVTAEELYSLHVNELLPDYTRKSQKLSEYENLNKPKEEVPEWKRPDYIPKSYAEVIEIAERNAIERIKGEKDAEEARIKEVSSVVDQQIAEIKKTEPNLDENALFLHANKWGFRDLKSAHENMRAMKQAELSAEQRTVKNLKARGADPISVTSPTIGDDGAIDYSAIATGKYGSALDFLNRIKSK